MKKALLVLLTFLMIGLISFAQEGYYKNGEGSSHKGGKYKNTATHDHYRTKKQHTPKASRSSHSRKH